LVGKTALFEYFGGAFGRRFNFSWAQSSAMSFLIGILIVIVLYNIPFIGLITFVLTGIWGLGGATSAAFEALRKEIPRKKTETPRAVPLASTSAGVLGSEPNVAPAAGAIPPIEDASGLAIPNEIRAGFLARVAAAFLDCILIGMVSYPFREHPIGLLIGLAYFSALWVWRGTTVGGILLNLKVKRLDGQAVTFPVALVRALAAGFSVFVFFLGFLWIIWDQEKQGWHDKIAGTVVVRVPSSSLI
jgi:uncharacterized RDD family membrane protein YckC